MNFGQQTFDAIGTAVVTAGLSYALLGRERQVEVFGMPMPHYVADAAINGLASITGDMTTDYANKGGLIPQSSNGFLSCIQGYTAPVITGLEFSALKKVMIAEQADSNIGYINKWDFAVGFAGKEIGSHVGKCLGSSMASTA